MTGNETTEAQRSSEDDTPTVVANTQENYVVQENDDPKTANENDPNTAVDDPETGESPISSNTKKIDIDELVQELEDSIDAETKRYKSVVYTLWIVAIAFLFLWVVGLPLAFAASEDWTYAASWYFSIQAGFGVGFGSLTVNTKGMEIFLIVHLFLGAISISFLIAYLLSRMIDGADQTKKSKAAMLEEELGEPVIAWKSWLIGSILLLLVIVMGVLYGLLYEKWNFTESLYFIVSTCQTSGLLGPSIDPKDTNDLFAPLFVSLLVILSVPLWAYNIGKASVELVKLDRAQRRQRSVMKRDRQTQDAFMRLAPFMGIDVLSEREQSNIQVNLAGYMVQWLIFNKLADETMIAAIIDEFNSYLEPGDEESTAPQWKIIARVRFLQLVQLGLLERNDWPAFCQEASHVVDKSIILNASSIKTRSGESMGALKASSGKGFSIASKRR